MNFDAIINRQNTNSLKYNSDDLQLWVADMDFAVASCIQEALTKRLAHPIYGYTCTDETLFEKVVWWWKNRHKVAFKADELVFSNGVVPTLGAILRVLSQKNDAILVQSPVYHAFFKIIKHNERRIIENELVYKNGLYFVNFQALEQEFATQKPKIMILCNPHNPVGKLYSAEELQKIIKLCKAYKVLLISDEIHCDLSQSPYYSVARLDDEALITLSVTKAFNLAGLSGSFTFIKDKVLRHKIEFELTKSGLTMPNPFFIVACKAALSKDGAKWLENLNAYIQLNKEFAYKFIEQNSPCKVIRAEALYMIWIDCSAFCKDTSFLCEFLREKFKLRLSKGRDFGKGGEAFLRLNLACARTHLQKALELFVEGIKAYKNEVQC